MEKTTRTIKRLVIPLENDNQLVLRYAIYKDNIYIRKISYLKYSPFSFPCWDRKDLKIHIAKQLKEKGIKWYTK